MALQAVYKQFLAAPSPDHLAEDASLHYVTTLTTYNNSIEIIKHFRSQTKLLKKKGETFLDAVEAPNALAVEVETTIEFLIGGGAYLPGLDDNFLADRTVTFPVIHIVSFNGHGKLQQVRLNWDQGSLLKLIDVIGKTGRNWPIRDGKDQIKLIANSVKHGGNHSTSNGEADPTEVLARSRGNSSNVTRDPHASLSLFAPRETTIEESMPEVVPPRASAKPPPRDYHDLFAGNESDQSPVTATSQKSNNRERSQSPSKSFAKGGAGQNYKPSRLFDHEENSIDTTQEKMYRPNPAKYQHFDFADGPDKPEPPVVKDLKNKGKHGSKWTFEDFVTPEKPVPTKTIRGQDVRHWGNSDDDVNESPIRREKVDKPRKDAKPHFEFVDDGTPENERRMIGRPRGAGLDNGMGLYRNNVYDEEESETAVPAPAASNALKTVTNVKDRRKDFDAHFEMRDDSPVTKNFPGNSGAYNESPIGGGNQKENINTFSAAKNENKMEQPLGLREGGAQAKKETGIVIGGDGMGGKKGAGRSWGFGDDSDGEESGGLNGAGGAYRKGMAGGGKKMGGTSQQTGGGDFWDF